MSALDPALLTFERSLASPSAHLVGVCGSGMRALAEFLVDLGWTVSGSDAAPGERLSELRSLGVRVRSECTGNASRLDALFHTPAVSDSHPTIQAAHAAGVPTLSYPEALGRIMQTRTGVAVAGTHGKSTTAAILSWLLLSAGMDPSAVFGASMPGDWSSGRAGRGELVVVESCEYRRAFLQQSPAMSLLLGVEPDHADCFASLEELESAFAGFVDQLPADGVLFANTACVSTRRIAHRADCRVVPFTAFGEHGWHVDHCEQAAAGLNMRIMHESAHHSDVWAPLSGRHHANNVLAAVAAASELGLSAAAIEQGLASFPGLRRRFEDLGLYQGVRLIDDYAHHPTAVAATLRAARRRFPRRRVVAVFEPHQLSRTLALFDGFTKALSIADMVCVAPVFAARESVRPEACRSVADRLAVQIGQAGTPAWAFASLDRVISKLDDALAPGDVLVTMGAGNVDRIQYEFTGRLQRHSEAG